ncbi:hypothetical protein [Streptomyces sp. NPDC017993]|uniref:hypothetical protein n=1 Tax=Streptomyces sp. NPDC017993 TaxID=3365027 RepID=UPI00378F1887
MRDRTHWVTLVLLPLVGAVGFWAVQGLWDWAWRSISGPPGLTAFASRAVGGEHLYLDPMEAADPATKCKRGVPVAAPGKPASLPITLQAKTDEAIMVIGVEVNVVSSKPPPTDGRVAEPMGCPAALKGRAFDVDLTRIPSPVVAPAGKAGSHQATDLPFTVTAEDPEQLNLRLRPGSRDVRFTVKVEWVADGKYGSVTLNGDEDRDGDGEPGYRVMGPGDASSAPDSPEAPSPSPPANTGSGSGPSG